MPLEMPPAVCPKKNALTCLGLSPNSLPEQIFISQPIGIVPREPISYIVSVVQESNLGVCKPFTSFRALDLEYRSDRRLNPTEMGSNDWLLNVDD